MAPLTNNKSRDDKKNGSTPFAAQLEAAKQKLFAEPQPAPAEVVTTSDIVSTSEVASTAEVVTTSEIISASPVLVHPNEVPTEQVHSLVADVSVAPPIAIPIVVSGERDIETPALVDTAVPVAPPAPDQSVATVPVAESEEDEMKRLDYSKIAARLYQGSKPNPEHDYARFTMVVLCAEEHQPALPNFRGRVIHAGFNDTRQPTQQDILVAGSAAEVVFRELVGGGTVLVTCYQGRNRSGLVTGLVMGRKMPGHLALARVREAREGALTNETYAELVRQSAIKPQVPSFTSPTVTEQSGDIAATTIARGPGIVERAIKAVFPRGTPGRPRGAGKTTIKSGTGRGYFGKARADRTPKPPHTRGSGGGR